MLRGESLGGAVTLWERWLAGLERFRAIAVIRSACRETGWQLAHSVARGGMGLIEITWDSAEAGDLIAQLREELPDCWVGTGTVLTMDGLRGAIACGAQFCLTPHTEPTLIRMAHEQGIPMIPGALTPTEIVGAWQAGAASVKVFPCGAVGGAQYIRALQGPLGTIPLIPTGGVTLDNGLAFLQAGAIAIGLSGDLFPREALEQQNWGAIVNRAASLMERINGMH